MFDERDCTTSSITASKPAEVVESSFPSGRIYDTLPSSITSIFTLFFPFPPVSASLGGSAEILARP